MELSERINLRLTAEQFAEVSTYARRYGLRRASAARLLIARGISAEGQNRGEQPAALAALLAAEHAVLMVASVLPEGERHMRELGQRASAAAEERLALFTPEREGDR
jgi:hypothetical protein